MALINHEDADSNLADSLWWFRGYAASRPAEERDQTYGMADKLLAVRRWLKDLTSGEKRLLGLADSKQAFVLTEHEFERISDALHPRASRNDREGAATLLREIYAEVRAERSLAAYDDIPF